MILDIQSVEKNFQQGKTIIPALKNISFNLQAKETLAIVGPSGSGKTTLLSLLGGLDTPDSGNVIVNNNDLAKMDQKQLSQFRAKNIGIVFQQFHLMPHLNARENISLPLEILGEKDIDKQTDEILQLVGLENRGEHLPHQLSGGECQRVAIARASVIRPKILLADEPSGNLDTETGTKVMDLLFNLVEESHMTMILVTHDLELAKRCHRQIHLQAGALQ